MYIKSVTLSNIILNELMRLKVRTSFFGFDGSFQAEELEKITSLVINRCDDIDGIEYLTNLRTLKIVGPNLDAFDIHSMPNDITDFSLINKIPSLEELIIWYDNNIRLLNISNLKKLKILNLKCNRNLSEIKGIDNLRPLTHICICGCPITNLGDLRRYIDVTKDTPTNIIDINMSPKIFANRELFTYLRNQLIANLSNIKFCEHIYFYDEMYTMSLEQAREEYKIAIEIIKGMRLEDKSEQEKVFEIYKYITTNVQYNYDDLKYREDNYEHYLHAPEIEKNYFLRRMAFINSSLSAFKTKKSVCNGYVNMAIYLLNLCDIKAEPVICKHNETLHSALKILINGKWIYADPEKDSKEKGIRYFDLTKEEMSVLYELSPREYIDELEGGHYAKHFS